jgi:hypothetical protein
MSAPLVVYRHAPYNCFNRIFEIVMFARAVLAMLAADGPLWETIGERDQS